MGVQISPLVLYRGSLTVEQLAVNESDAGSSPAPGVVVGWPSGKAPVLKTGERESVRGFESYTSTVTEDWPSGRWQLRAKQYRVIPAEVRILHLPYELLFNRKLHFSDVLIWIWVLSTLEMNLAGRPDDAIVIVFHPTMQGCMCLPHKKIIPGMNGACH